MMDHKFISIVIVVDPKKFVINGSPLMDIHIFIRTIKNTVVPTKG